MWQHQRRRGENQEMFGLSSAFFLIIIRKDLKVKEMKYEGYIIGPNIYKLRTARKMTRDKLSEKTGLSISTITQVESGGRKLSLNSLYLLMDAFQCDANTILNIKKEGCSLSVDEELRKLPKVRRNIYQEFFLMILRYLPD